MFAYLLPDLMEPRVRFCSMCLIVVQTHLYAQGVAPSACRYGAESRAL